MINVLSQCSRVYHKLFKGFPLSFLQAKRNVQVVARVVSFSSKRNVMLVSLSHSLIAYQLFFFISSILIPELQGRSVSVSN